MIILPRVPREDDHYLGLGGLSGSHVCQTHITSFPWAYQERMIILFGVLREDAHSHKRVRGLTHYQAQ